MKTVLITGAAGFVGFHMSDLLCQEGYNVVGIDSLNGYYDVQLKRDRLKQLEKYENFTFSQVDISDKPSLDKVYADNKVSIVINLAAQAGVRYSIENPYQYMDSNIAGCLNVLEACRNFGVEHLIFASSSSVYGANSKTPFNIDDHTDHPISLYAATKKANEAMVHSYSALYGIPSTGLRFFTVYGPWGRPDMAYYIFTEKILRKEPIQLFNGGKMKRDFTYVDDITKTISALIDNIPQATPERKGTVLNISESFAPYRLYNIGNNKPVELTRFLSILEELIGEKAIVEHKPMQPGDMLETYADIDKLTKAVGFAPQTDIRSGLEKFVEWYRAYYKV